MNISLCCASRSYADIDEALWKLEVGTREIRAQGVDVLDVPGRAEIIMAGM